MNATALLYKGFVRLTLLEQVSPKYLIRFLRPFEDYLKKQNFYPCDMTFDDEQIAKLHHVLNAPDPSMPMHLRQALHDIANLTGETAHEQLLELAFERQLSLLEPGETLSPTDLAFKTYLEHGELFESIRSRVLTSEPRKFVEFLPIKPSVPGGLGSTQKIGELKSRLGDWFKIRNRTEYCDVRFCETDDEVMFLIIHGRPPTTHCVIKNAKRTRISYIRDKQDLLVFNKSTGGLAINAQYPIEQDFYRRALGKIFFGSDEHFVSPAVFSGLPLIEEGEAAFNTEGISSLDKVTLRELKIISTGRQRQHIHWSGDDLTEMTSSTWGRKTLEMGDIRYLKLAFYFLGIVRPLTVEITLPNKLKYDRRFGENVVREFLLTRGFMKTPDESSQFSLAIG